MSPAERIDALVAEYGLAVVSVFPDMERGLPPMSYSVGMADAGLPELVMTGIEARGSMVIINTIAAELRQRGADPAEGELLSDGIIAGGFQARFRQLSQAEIAANLFAASARAEAYDLPPIRAFQIVYQDESHRWPEDRGYSHRMALLLAQGEKETKQ